MAEPRQWVVDTLRRAGYPEIAEQAERELPDQVTRDEAMAFAAQHGLSLDEINSRMGGSP
jgi:hypothetical protein